MFTSAGRCRPPLRPGRGPGLA